MLRPPIDNTLFGYMVLRATTRVPTLPPLDRILVHVEDAHLEGRYYGTVVNGCAREPEEFYYPQRSRKRRIFSALDAFYDSGMERVVSQQFADLEKESETTQTYDDLIESAVQSKLTMPHLLAVNQVGFNASVTLMCRDVELRLYGVHSQSMDLLVWTNLHDYASMLLNYPYLDAWVYPFEPMNYVCRALHTQHICSRWHRWSSLNTLQRFAALERHLFRKFRG